MRHRTRGQGRQLARLLTSCSPLFLRPQVEERRKEGAFRRERSAHHRVHYQPPQAHSQNVRVSTRPFCLFCTLGVHAVQNGGYSESVGMKTIEVTWRQVPWVGVSQQHHHTGIEMGQVDHAFGPVGLWACGKGHYIVGSTLRARGRLTVALGWLAA